MRKVLFSLALLILLAGMAGSVIFTDNVVIGKNLTVIGTSSMTGVNSQIGNLSELNNGESTVVEALNATDDRLDGLETDTADNTSRVEVLEANDTSHDDLLAELRTDVNDNTSRVEVLEARVYNYLHVQTWDTVLLGATLTNASAIPLSFEDPLYNLSIANWTLATYAQPDVARVIKATPSGSNTGSMTFVGYDIEGAVISDTLEWSASSAAKTTAKAFYNISSVTGSFTGDSTFAVAAGDALGSDYDLTDAAVIVAYFDGTMETTAPTLSANATVLSKNLVTFDTALNSKDLVLVLVIPPVVE